ncbi:hypothetical protein M3J09_010007 [Ascochyta lentis]
MRPVISTRTCLTKSNVFAEHSVSSEYASAYTKNYTRKVDRPTANILLIPDFLHTPSRSCCLERLQDPDRSPASEP